jgi:hypothetical protein
VPELRQRLRGVSARVLLLRRVPPGILQRHQGVGVHPMPPGLLLGRSCKRGMYACVSVCGLVLSFKNQSFSFFFSLVCV